MSSDWNFRSPPKRPPPSDGVKVTQLGATWWGQRWIESLERFSREYLSRLGRGRTYARTGRVNKLRVSAGKVTARVTGSEDTPYLVTIAMDVFSARTWNVAIAAMAQEARFAAELLAGRMPADIDIVFKRSKCSLFPRKSHDLETDCSCPDWASPCKHVAAVHYVLGEAFDRDPFLLFELRGRTREQILNALSRRRSGGEETAPAKVSELTASSMEIPSGDPADYDKPAQSLPMLSFSFESPAPGAILRSLGAPRGWSLAQSPAEFFAPLYANAAELAREMALSPSGEMPAIPAETSAKQAGRKRAGVRKGRKKKGTVDS